MAAGLKLAGPGARGLCLGSLAVAAVCALTAGPAQAQTDRPEVTSLDLRGNRVFSDDSLRAAIVNRSTECRLPGIVCALGIDLRRRNYLQPRELPLDVLRLEYYYRQRGYREAQVDMPTSYSWVGCTGSTCPYFSIRAGSTATPN